MTDKCGTLRANMGDNQPAICYPVTSIKGNFIDRDTRQNGIGWNDGGVSYTLDATDRHAVCFQQNQREEVRDMGEKVGALTAESGMHNTNYVCYALDLQGGKGGANHLKNKCPTVLSDSHGTPHAVCYPINTMVATRGGRDDMRTTFGIGEDGDPQFTLQAAHSHAVCYEAGDKQTGQDRVIAIEGNEARPSHLGGVL